MTQNIIYFCLGLVVYVKLETLVFVSKIINLSPNFSFEICNISNNGFPHGLESLLAEN